MENVVTMKRAGMRNNDELVIDLADGSTIEFSAEQSLSLHPHLIGNEKKHGGTTGGPET